jgi:superfamily II DNA or RNA helicase
VTDVRADATTFAARVIGTSRYDVELVLDDNRLRIECTCPQFVENLTPCKHIWAAILAADERRAFAIPAGLWVDWHEGADFEQGYGRGRSEAEQRPSQPSGWQLFLSQVSSAAEPLPRSAVTGELLYVLDVARSMAHGTAVIDIMTRERKRSGEWAKPRPLSMSRPDIARLTDPNDREILERLSGAAFTDPFGSSYFGSPPVASSCTLNVTLQREVVPRLCETGRFLARTLVDAPPEDRRRAAPHYGVPWQAAAKPTAVLTPIVWDASPVEAAVRVRRADADAFTIDVVLRRDGDNRPQDAAMFVTGALILWKPADAGAPMRFAPLDTGGADRWIAQLLATGPVTVPSSESAALTEAIVRADLRAVECPDELRVAFEQVAPHPIVRISPMAAPYAYHQYGRLDVKLTFAYGAAEIDVWDPDQVVVDRDRRVAYRRNRDAERAALGRLKSVGVRALADWQTQSTRLDCADTVLPALVRTLMADGWTVEAAGRLYRRPSAFSLEVSSGVDWFELHGTVDFGGVAATLPALLAAARRHDGFVPLGDGTFGLLPEEWLARSARIAAIGTPEGDHVRFAPSQAALLDAWLATEPAVRVDEAFARARAELARFDGIAPADPPRTFAGVLRDYQRDALGWFEFLRRFHFGGCLADEMGLGKTVMVLAMLEARRLAFGSAEAHRPSLVVVPRSLIFNWRQEAARFAPALRVLDFTGGSRREALATLPRQDLVLTTYGTLRRDVGLLKDIEFDYAILDEAQAIKNARTNAAKAVRLLRARHRLALSGTPVENHLGELWSLFDFLNPGILGASSVFAAAAAATAADGGALALLAAGLRPFILRRTKEQVAAELPLRTEQTLSCELEPVQRRLYDELRDHYRGTLLGAVAAGGLGRAKLHVLEALLRLRQAACHPGLIDPARAGEPSAKLDVLIPRLQELIEDGRRALVFSQFTSLLAILRARLDEAGMAYEYLDGRTRDRAARVERFQRGGCPLFLISLKAGGQGLNLTAADYVFLLDPWWNPAVEAQAIDRAHRIGQTRPVFACRLIARNTVEEKVLELQATKRKLADAIIRADGALIRDLKREDLELLLS